MNHYSTDLKFTDSLERELIQQEFNLHEYDASEGTSERVLTVALFAYLALGVPLLVELLH